MNLTASRERERERERERVSEFMARNLHVFVYVSNNFTLPFA
jgi:hypothetical protein